MYMRTMQQLRADPEAIADLCEFTGEPVFITDRGQISHVLLSYETFTALHQSKNMAELLACPESVDFDFEPEKLSASLTKPVDFS